MSESKSSLQFDLTVFQAAGKRLIERAKAEPVPAERDRLMNQLFETLEGLLEDAASASPVHH
jgi:hypothetical protein